MQEPCRLSADAEFSAADVFQAVRRFLVYDIEPVVVEQMGVAAPGEDRLVLVVVLGIVMLGNADGQAFIFVAQVFGFQRPPVVFEVA